jgi:hypothetical protein
LHSRCQSGRARFQQDRGKQHRWNFDSTAAIVNSLTVENDVDACTLKRVLAESAFVNILKSASAAHVVHEQNCEVGCAGLRELKQFL